MKTLKKFTYNGIELRIVNREEPLYRGGRSVITRRVIAPNGGIIPVAINRGQTLKSLAASTIELLDNFGKRGADVNSELTKQL